MNVDSILDRLDKVRQNGPGRWVACCPAHDDRSPSFSVKDGGDRVLLYCHGGCQFDEVVAALGLHPHELFEGGTAPRHLLPGITRRDVLDTLVTEVLICEIADADRAAGRPISDADAERIRQARQFVQAAAGVAHG